MQSDDKKNNINNTFNGDIEDNQLYQPADINDEENSDNGQTNSVQQQNEIDDEMLVRWQANESMNGEKSVAWFIVFTVVALALIAADIFFIKSYTFSALVVIMALSVVVLSKKPPRLINYSLTVEGLYVNEKIYPFNEFKSFGIISDGDKHLLSLIPIKRFSPSVSAYFPYEVGEKIVDILGVRLPMEKIKPDIIDQIVKKLKL